jgi:hypothetical protein
MNTETSSIRGPSVSFHRSPCAIVRHCGCPGQLHTPFNEMCPRNAPRSVVLGATAKESAGYKRASYWCRFQRVCLRLSSTLWRRAIGLLARIRLHGQVNRVEQEDEEFGQL